MMPHLVILDDPWRSILNRSVPLHFLEMDCRPLRHSTMAAVIPLPFVVILNAVSEPVQAVAPRLA